MLVVHKKIFMKYIAPIGTMKDDYHHSTTRSHHQTAIADCCLEMLLVPSDSERAVIKVIFYSHLGVLHLHIINTKID